MLIAPSSDVELYEARAINVSNLMLEHDAISQLDLNPVIVYPEGVCAVDSRIILGQIREV